MRKFVHDFLKWAPVAAGGGTMAVCSVWSTAKDWTGKYATWAWSQITNPWVACSVATIIFAYIAAIIWTGQSRPTVTSSRFAEPLKDFYADGMKIQMMIQASAPEYSSIQIDKYFLWCETVSLWICSNMGRFALSKFMDVKPDYTPTTAPPASEAGFRLIREHLSNILALISSDAWDPVGKPILPAEGCEQYVGKSTDKPFTGGPQ